MYGLTGIVRGFYLPKNGPYLGHSPHPKPLSMICQILYFRHQITKSGLILENAKVRLHYPCQYFMQNLIKPN